VDPISFIDSIESKQHLLLVYKEERFRQMIQYRFINSGLINGEHSIIITHGKTKMIENEMSDYGLDVDRYKNKLLHIYEISDPLVHPTSIVDGFTETVTRILADSVPPYRITGRLSHRVDTEEKMSVCARFEDLFHSSMFESFDGSVLCTYGLEEIQANNAWKQWLKRLSGYHDASIIQTRDGKESITVSP
jgi:DcmR-like sensory protein